MKPSRWIVLYDDGRTPKIHKLEVEAPNMITALASLKMPQKHVFACTLISHEGAAGASLLASMNLGLVTIRTRDETE